MRRLPLQLVILLCLPAAAFAAVRPPAPVVDAIRAEFPGAVVRNIERERERGVLIYEVSLAYKGRNIEVEFSSDGAIGEIESVVEFDDVPPSVQVELQELVGSGRIIRIEKHERRGVGRYNRFEPLDEPEVLYEAKYVQGNRRGSVTVRYHEPAELPDTVHKAIKKAYDGAKVIDAQSLREHDRKLFTVLVKAHDGLDHVVMTPDGLIVEVGRSMDVGDMPDVARRGLAVCAAGARIAGLQKVRRHADFAEGKYATLDKPLELFRARLVRGPHYADVLVNARGDVHSQSDWRPVNEEDDGDDQGDES